MDLFNSAKEGNVEHPVFADYEKCQPVETDGKMEYYQTGKEIPNIKMSDILHVNWMSSPDAGRWYKNEIAEIQTTSGMYYVIRYDLEDPSGGLFGGMGSWSPFRVVLFGDDYREISEHSETNGADHIRFTDIRSNESLIRWLTVHHMIKSEFSDEIQAENEKLISLYRTLYETNEAIIEAYRRRENVPDVSPLLYHYENATFEEMMKRNGELDN